MRAPIRGRKGRSLPARIVQRERISEQRTEIVAARVDVAGELGELADIRDGERARVDLQKVARAELSQRAHDVYFRQTDRIGELGATQRQRAALAVDEIAILQALAQLE